MAKSASNNPLQQIVYNGTCFVFTKTRHFKLPLRDEHETTSEYGAQI